MLGRFRKVPRKLREGSTRLRNGFPKDFPLLGTEVPQGSVNEGSASVFLRISLKGRFCRVPRRFLAFKLGRFRKVPRRFRKVTVPRRFREGSARFCKGSPKVARRFCNVPQGSARSRKGFARFREGSARQGTARFRNLFCFCCSVFICC